MNFLLYLLIQNTMKRIKSLFNQIINYDNVRLAWIKARKGKTSKQAVMQFSKDVNANLLKVQRNLKSKPPVLSSYTQFTIFDPKKRIISVVPFIDRVMHHAIMNVLESVFERQFIFHTYACRKKKGSHKAIKYTHLMCRKAKYFLKLDVRKYFDNINHQVLKNMLMRIIKDKDCLNLLFEIIDSYDFSKEGKGLPIGNLTSQFFANFYLSALDHFVLEKLKPIGYVRYMDDFLLFENSKNQLKEKLKVIRTFCKKKLFLELKPYVLGTCKTGVSYLGYFINSYSIRFNQKTKKRKRRKLKKLNFELENEFILEEEYVNKVKCLLSSKIFFTKLKK